jgi:hypothetical protein
MHTNNRGIVYRIKGEFARAIAHYDEAISLKNGQFPAALLQSGGKGEYEQIAQGLRRRVAI